MDEKTVSANRIHFCESFYQRWKKGTTGLWRQRSLSKHWGIPIGCLAVLYITHDDKVQLFTIVAETQRYVDEIQKDNTLTINAMQFKLIDLQLKYYQEGGIVSAVTVCL